MLPRPDKPELLAPAGREDVFWAVLEAGADAVYLAGKSFNMRRHRRDYNFADADLARLTDAARARGKHLYVTVNSLVTERELPALRDYLRRLDDFGVDALIVQDLAVVHLARELGLRTALHASTMMNVNSPAQAALLKGYGFTRVVPSRDITLAEVARIRAEAGIEVETFVHGDLCSVQSGQCLASGLLFGKSSNRGQCMKPCRWAWDLFDADSGAVLATQRHLLAARDICLLQHLPELLHVGVDALKIEGRMRPAETLAPLVAAYRAALDRLVTEPLLPARDAETADALFRRRTRNLSTGFTFAVPDATYIDPGGEREPLFLSRAGRLDTVAENAAWLASLPPLPATSPAAAARLTVVAGTAAGAAAALDGGPDTVLLAWEGDLTPAAGWRVAEVRALAAQARARGVRLGLVTPRILAAADLDRLAQTLRLLPELDPVCITGLGALPLVRAAGREAWIDPALNVLNSAAARFLLAQGATRIGTAPEAGLDETGALAAALPPGTLELPLHGPLTGMVIEHCLLAMVTQHSSRHAVCRMPCAAGRYRLRDRQGTVRELRTDRHCRNHLLLEHTFTALPLLPRLLALQPAALRLDARLVPDARLSGLLAFYRGALAAPATAASRMPELAGHCPGQSFSLGALPLGIGADDAISRLELKREERDAERRPDPA